jgi:hypothetical protein
MTLLHVLFVQITIFLRSFVNYSYQMHWERRTSLPRKTWFSIAILHCIPIPSAVSDNCRLPD